MLSDVTISAIALGGASILGSVIGFAVRRVPHKWNDIFLGFCAGMMLGAAIVCLIAEGISMTGVGGMWQVGVGVILGVALISCIDFLTPHLHHLAGLECEEERHPDSTRSIDRILLFVLAIAIHKLPEGIATGLTFDGHDIGNAWTVTAAIALQNIPEGLVVVTPLLLIGAGGGAGGGRNRTGWRVRRLFAGRHIGIAVARDARACRGGHAVCAV